MFRMTIKTKTEGYLNYGEIIAYDFSSLPEFIFVKFTDNTELYYSKKDIVSIWVSAEEEETEDESN